MTTSPRRRALIAAGIGVLAAPWIVWATAPGFADEAERFDLTVDLLRVTFPYILLISLSSLAGAILNTWNRFSVPAFVPTLLNVSIIVFALFLTPYFDPPIMALGWAVLVGGLAQLLWQLPHLKKIGMLVLPRLSFGDLGVWRVLKQMGPAIFGVSVSQISLIINTVFASFLVAGSVSWMYYADRLMELPSGVLGVALGTILLPSLSNAHAAEDMEEYSALLDWGLRLTFMLAMPSAVGLATLSEPLTATLFHYGRFDALSVTMVGHALVAYGVGLIGLIVVKILAPGFYAKQDIRTPVIIAVGVLIATQLMNSVFVPMFSHAGLALSIGLGACLNALCLYIGLRRRQIYVPRPGWGMFLVRLTGALLVMAGVALWISGHFDWVALRAHPVLRIGALLLVLAVCAAAYFGPLFAMGFRLREFKRIARR